MLLKGLQKTSLLDYPDKISAIVFTGGCNFRCPFCYNKELVVSVDTENFLSEDDFFTFLKKRKKTLDAVVVTGGEPTLHKDLPGFIQKIKNLNLLVKLDSNGTNPDMINNLLKKNLLDYIAMDIKGPLEKYHKIVNMNVDTGNIKKSIDIIKKSDIPYEFRSTIMPRLHSREDIVVMAEMISGADKYYLQKFRAGSSHIDPSFSQEKGFTDKEMQGFVSAISSYFEICDFR